MLGYFNYDAYTTKPVGCNIPHVILVDKKTIQSKIHVHTNKHKKKRKKKGAKNVKVL